ncbi:aspartate kinase [Granulosicoccus antarcticus]|uniref:Aspartokinase n=1 Tax=Granulosicoccus antarcticus IMCC3135 TaxID=1192854 RepID=A0A2Z2NR46_9GAMM|nr:aspartate kinase [Granulosicoccus antarcticus]ASJ72471.1 Aspartate kinase [Granulosicoccus antarcticus IMCC3135]
MAFLVKKYGGTSVGSVERIQHVAQSLKQARDAGDDVVVVVSAMSGETNRLVAMAREVMPAVVDVRELDVLLSTGEQVTIALLTMALKELGVEARSYTGAQVRILTDNSHSKARILDIDTARIMDDIKSGRVVVVAGFQGVSEEGDITTLGRGGSDTSAVALAAALKCDECQIFTDVDGVYTTDPRVEKRARRLDRITFEEMLEMASLGSKVLQIRAVEFAGKYNVPLRVLSSFKPGDGTLITYDDEENTMEQALVSGIAFTRDEAQITVTGVADRPGTAYAILGPISDLNVEVDMIIQNIGANDTTDFTFTVHRDEYTRVIDYLKSNNDTLGATTISGDDRIAKLSIVGVGMRSHAGIASRMFRSLADAGINLRLITTSEIKISVVIDEKYIELGVRALHEEFELGADEVIES